MAGAQMHYPQSWSFVHFLWNYPTLDGGKGQYSEIVIKLIDGFKVGKPRDVVYKDAFQVKGNDGNNYFGITSTYGSNAVNFGNVSTTTSYNFLGTGTTTHSGGVAIAVS